MERRRRGFEGRPTRLPQLLPALAADKRRREGARKTQRREFNFHRSATSRAQRLMFRIVVVTHVFTVPHSESAVRQRMFTAEGKGKFETRTSSEQRGLRLELRSADARPAHRSVHPCLHLSSSRVTSAHTRPKQKNVQAEAALAATPTRSDGRNDSRRRLQSAASPVLGSSSIQQK